MRAGSAKCQGNKYSKVRGQSGKELTLQAGWTWQPLPGDDI